MSSAFTGWKNPIAGTALPNQARSTCKVRSRGEQTVPPEPPAPDPGDDADHEEDQAQQPDEVAEPDVECRNRR